MRSILAIEIILKKGIYQVRIYKKGSENEMHIFKTISEVNSFLELQTGYLVEEK